MAKRREEEAKQGAPEWMATFSDMMTLLLCFFVLLFSMSSIDVAKFKALAEGMASNNLISVVESSGSPGAAGAQLGADILQLPDSGRGLQTSKTKDNTGTRLPSASENEKKELNKIAESFKSYFAENELSSKIAIEVDPDSHNIRLIMQDLILFDSGKADLKEEAIEVLDLVSEKLAEFVDNDISIEGHTDNVPIGARSVFKDNWDLSTARALSVLLALIERGGLNPERLSSTGYSQYRPVATNDTPEGKAQNRRVEIKIVSTDFSSTTTSNWDVDNTTPDLD